MCSLVFIGFWEEDVDHVAASLLCGLLCGLTQSIARVCPVILTAIGLDL